MTVETLSFAPTRTGARLRAAALTVAVLVTVSAGGQSDRVTVRVDSARTLGPMKPVWAFFGYDEPNYTCMKDGRKLLTELAALSPVPVYVRMHNLLTSGDGTAGLKRGSTNACTEDASGRPHYDWTIVDRIFDTLLVVGRPRVPVGGGLRGQRLRHEADFDERFHLALPHRRNRPAVA